MVIKNLSHQFRTIQPGLGLLGIEPAVGQLGNLRSQVNQLKGHMRLSGCKKDRDALRSRPPYKGGWRIHAAFETSFLCSKNNARQFSDDVSSIAPERNRPIVDWLMPT